jgi:hypothetical protein
MTRALAADVVSETLSAFPPGAVLVFGGLLLPFLAQRLRPIVLLGLPLVTIAWVLSLPDGSSAPMVLLGYDFVWVRSDTLGRLFATIFSLMAFAGGLYAIRQRNVLELTAAFCYAGGAIGVALSGDLITLFVFWEAMAVASSLVILSVGTPKSFQVGMRYFIVRMFGGAVLMAGIVLHISDTGSTAFEFLGTDSFAKWLILVGVLINAAAPPMSAWLADAYPEASHWHRVLIGVYDEGCRLRLNSRVSRHRSVNRSGRVYDLLRDHFRTARERHASYFGLQHRESGRVHGDRDWHRDRDGAQRCGGSCIRPHHLQGLAVDVRGRGVIRNRQT